MEDVGVSLVEELLTDFLQLIHATIRNLIPTESGGADSDDESERGVQNTIRYILLVSSYYNDGIKF